MCINTINEIKQILLYAGYEKELNDILFIEDFEPIEFEPLDLDFEPLDLDFEPLEFDELY